MWNFYQQNLRELPECLAKMQDRGMGEGEELLRVTQNMDVATRLEGSPR